MNIKFLTSIHEVSADHWNKLWSPSDDLAYPFAHHAFLAALEDSGSTTSQTGWIPCHLIVENNGVLIAAMLLYEKTHSYGEYVFDWAWADAYNRHGLDYYPKLVNAVPFTPSTGARIAIRECACAIERMDIIKTIFTHIQQRIHDIGGSGFHCLFPDIVSQEIIKPADVAQRQGLQFHWFNQNYANFDDFLATFNSRKRKALNKERKKVEQYGLRIQLKQAQDVTDDEWQFFYLLYHRTYLKRSGRHGYLGEDFFYRLAKSMPDHTLLATVYRDNEFIAGALYLRDQHTLYGRYWGAKQDIDGLHFETCYYQGIDYAIRHGLHRFDPGAQGEHKIQRGFTPVLTCSYHWLAQPDFYQAVSEFLLEEKKHNKEALENTREYLPFKQDTETVSENILLATQ